MLARRLLITGGGGSIAPTPEDDLMRVVAYLTRLSNIVTTEDTAFEFTTSRVMDTAYFTWAGTGNPLVCVQSRWYWLHVNLTTLGTDYGGANNSDWVAAITRNGLTLNDMVVAERHAHANAVSADLMSLGSPVYLESGDEIEVLVQNVNGTTLLIESNPTDGVPSGYLTDAGPGTLSPHLIVVALSGDAPS